MLTEAKIKAAQPRERPYKVTDARSLYLFVTPAGNKVFRYSYTYGGKAKTLVIGPWPDVKLAAARAELTKAKAHLREGRDPSAERRLAGGAAGDQPDQALFRYWGDDWMRVMGTEWSPIYAARVKKRLERHAYPKLGTLPIARIEPIILLPILRQLNARAGWEAKSLRDHLSCIFEHAAGPLNLKYNPAALLRKACPPPQAEHYESARTIEHARGVLAAVDNAKGHHSTTRLAHRFLALTGVRVNELRWAKWSEVTGLDGNAPTWTIPAERMKGRKRKKRAHVVPLAPQAVEVLTVLRAIQSDRTWIFPGPKQPRDQHDQARKPINQVAFSTILRAVTLPCGHVPHGWRSSFLTIMNETYRGNRDVLDMMLAHKPTGVSDVEDHYNHAEYLDRRRELAGLWADLLLKDAPSAWDLANMSRTAIVALPITLPQAA